MRVRFTVTAGSRIGSASVGEVFRTPDGRFEGLPGYDFDPDWFEQDELRLHYLDEGSGDPVVCFHGEPTWAFLYRKMVPPLVATAWRGSRSSTRACSRGACRRASWPGATSPSATRTCPWAS